MRIAGIVMSLLCLITAPSAASAQATDVPVDVNLTVVAPSDEVAKEIAAFSGKWAGPFNGVKSKTYMSDAFMAVEEIVSATNIRVYYAQAGRFRTNLGSWYVRANAKIMDGKLEFTTPDALVIACTTNGNDTLDCTITNAQGGQNRGTFQRVK